MYQSNEFPDDVFPLHTSNTLDAVEYVQMMSDVLRMNKNLCICRNFYKLHKEKARYVLTLFWIHLGVIP